jgi:hypothetical protein
MAFTKSHIWDFVMESLNISIQAEVAIAISQDLTNEKRSHTAGRAESLVDLQNYLMAVRQESLNKHTKVMD